MECQCQYPECGCKVLRQAGFEEVSVTTRPLSGRFETPRDAAALGIGLSPVQMELLPRIPGARGRPELQGPEDTL